MANPRVHEIAAELGIESNLAMDKLKEMGEYVKSPSSSIAPPVARRLKAALEADGVAKPKPADAKPAPKPAAAKPAPAQPAAPAPAPVAEAPAAPAPAPAQAPSEPAAERPGAPAAPGYTDPYAGAYAASPYAQGPQGVQPMTWRTVLGYVFGAIATLFVPIVFGVLAIVFASLAVKQNEKTSRIALGVAVAGTIIGFILGALSTQMLT